MKLLELEPKGRFVFIGDTHGDLNASKTVVKRYLNQNTSLVFLGDYVDRGPNSKGNADYLINKREKNPDKIHLLQGNHDRIDLSPHMSPANFWDRLSPMEKDDYCNVFKEFPIIASVGGIVALHGALPNVKNLGEINEIKNTSNDEKMHVTLWGDWVSGRDEEGVCPFTGRPYFGKSYFNKIMKNIKKNVLIRGHQPGAGIMFDNKCLTIFTSNAYKVDRTVAIADFDKKKRITSVDDLVIEVI